MIEPETPASTRKRVKKLIRWRGVIRVREIKNVPLLPIQRFHRMEPPRKKAPLLVSPPLRMLLSTQRIHRMKSR